MITDACMFQTASKQACRRAAASFASCVCPHLLLQVAESSLTACSPCLATCRPCPATGARAAGLGCWQSQLPCCVTEGTRHITCVLRTAQCLLPCCAAARQLPGEQPSVHSTCPAWQMAIIAQHTPAAVPCCAAARHPAGMQKSVHSMLSPAMPCWAALHAAGHLPCRRQSIHSTPCHVYPHVTWAVLDCSAQKCSTCQAGSAGG